MKAIVAFVGFLTISWVSAQAPYPPSGYRPQGPQFSLPSPNNNQGNQGFGSGFQPQNQYFPPSTNQYTPPDNTPKPPPNQYLPALQPSDLKFGQSKDQIGERDFSNQGDSFNQQTSFGGQQAPQQQYGTPGQNLQQLEQNNRQQLDQNRQQLEQNRQRLDQNRQYYNQQQSYLSQSKNVEQQGFIGQSVSDQNQGFGTGNVNNQQGWSQRPIPRTSASERNYLAPRENLQQQNQQKFGKKPNVRQQLYQSPSPQTNDEDSDQTDDQAFSGNEDQNVNVANQNYLPPTTTERRRYPEPTTRRPDVREGAAPEDNEAQDPNVAVATAVARGQYYLWQPDGRLQRVLYKTTQTQEDLQNNAYSAKLVYQAVQPIAAPIYTYNAPLVSLT